MNTYQIDSGLVHKLIWTIIAAILSIGGYMVVWAINDSRFKQEVRTTLVHINRHIEQFERHMAEPCHDVACERFRIIEQHPHHRNPNQMDDYQ